MKDISLNKLIKTPPSGAREIKNYWENRYKVNETGWDIGYISTPIKNYIDQLTDKSMSILIPGAGNGYEFDYLVENNFKNVYVIDIADQPIKNLKSKHPNLGKQHFICDDFFRLNEKFDLILEQTFFCALNPEIRTKYVDKMYDLLNDSGKIVGLLFDFPLSEIGPPFGGSTNEYLELFSNKFEIKTLDRCYNSIKPRAEKELFINFLKK